MNLVKTIKKVGINDSLSLRDQKLIVFSNFLWVISLITVIAVLSFIIFLVDLQHLYYYYIITILTLLFTNLSVPFIFKKGEYTLGKFLLLFAGITTTVVSHFTFEQSAGFFLYYLPELVACLIIFSWEKEKKYLVFFFLYLLLVYMFSLLASDTYFMVTPIKLSKYLHRMLLALNAVLAFGSTVFMVYYLVSENILFNRLLENSKINLKTLIDNLRGSVWSIDKNYKLIAFNNAFAENVKKSTNGRLYVSVGTDLSEIPSKYGVSTFFLDNYKRTLNGEALCSEFFDKNNWFEFYSTPIYDSTNNITGACFYTINVTDRKKMTEEAIQAKEKAEEATNIKTRFLANMSHELRTPLNGIIGLTNILLSENKLPMQEQHLEMLKYSSDHMLELINNILDFNKIEAGKLELEQVRFNLFSETEELTRVFKITASKKGIELITNIDEHAKKWIIGDMMRLRQVLVNLISNAIKFTEKGKVEFRVDVTEKTTENNYSFCFKIIDTGIGIPADKLHKIFESFSQVDARTTRKYGGSGLGLTIAKKLIELMGGNLYVTSLENSGSTFWFNLQFEVTTPEKYVQKKKIVSELEPFKNLQLLVTEDNAVNRMVAGKILEKWDIAVSFAINGAEAVEKVHENSFDVILMDLEMPIMDGFTATAEIRKFNKTVPIIALTAASYEDMETEFLKWGMNGYIKKPFHPEELHRKIQVSIAQ